MSCPSEHGWKVCLGAARLETKMKGWEPVSGRQSDKDICYSLPVCSYLHSKWICHSCPKEERTQNVNIAERYFQTVCWSPVTSQYSQSPAICTYVPEEYTSNACLHSHAYVCRWFHMSAYGKFRKATEIVIAMSSGQGFFMLFVAQGHRWPTCNTTVIGGEISGVCNMHIQKGPQTCV